MIVLALHEVPAVLMSQGSVEKEISDMLLTQGISSVLTEVDISSSHFDERSGINHIYYLQKYEDLPIYDAMGIIAVKKEKIIHKTSRLLISPKNFDKTKSKITPETAVSVALDYLGVEGTSDSFKFSVRTDKKFEANQAINEGGITGRKMWYKNSRGLFRQTWVIETLLKMPQLHSEIFIDAATGEFLGEHDLILRCTAGNLHKCSATGKTYISKKTIPENYSRFLDESAYRVFAPPIESPDVGGRVLIENPADADASPFGWHDINGMAGADFNTLRGNNVHAYVDSAANNNPDLPIPQATETLTFDFPFDPDTSVIGNIEADLTNLFYWTNYVHDWSYRFGFDEEAGNFQENNYTRGGLSGDPLLAETLDGADLNNATIITPRDGTSPILQMHTWILPGTLDISQPVSIAREYNTGTALFGPTNLSEPIIESIILIQDDSGNPTDACESISNVNALEGNIALVDRGLCDFSLKVFMAQEAGAKACIVCNNNPGQGPINMGAGQNAEQINIPSYSLSKEDCDLIKAELDNGVTARFNAITEISSSFDNGVVVHEYGHGITIRLAGGANTNSCLNNGENLGEGWSDFFMIALTQAPGDVKELSRPVGTYLLGQNLSERGIRRYPYSYDMNVNPQVMSHVRYNLRIHDIGEIWASALWDLYWMMIEEYGFDHEWRDTTSGNYQAMQLIFTGLKIQECDPGFIEARDAILEADQLLNDGLHSCLLWKVFARRGIGSNAFGGTNDSPFDNVDGYDIPGECIGEVLIEKSVTSLVEPGDTIRVTISIANFKEDLTQLTLTDRIPDGTSFIDALDNLDIKIQGKNLSWTIAELKKGSELSFSYLLSTSGLSASRSTFLDDFEREPVNFITTSSNSTLEGWQHVSKLDFNGMSMSVFPDTTGGESYIQVVDPILITNESNLLRFDHTFELDLGFDGGVVEVSRDNGGSWNVIRNDQFVIRPPNDEISNCLFSCPQPDYFYRNVLDAYTGNQDWATTVVDLSEYIGQSVLIRFRYISLLFNDDLDKKGWSIDNIEIFEKIELAESVCLRTNGSLIGCAASSTFVESTESSTSIKEVHEQSVQIRIAPNPSSEILNVAINSEHRREGYFRIMNEQGEVLHRMKKSINAGNTIVDIDISALIPGVYFVEYYDRIDRHTEKVIIQD